MLDITILGKPSNIRSYELQGGFGASISKTGDINNDGFADIIIGNSEFATSAGKSYIYFGGAAPDSSVDIELEGEWINNLNSYSLSILSDINGDGFDDIITGAPGYRSAYITELGTGRAYVYFGGTEADTLADLVLSGDPSFGNFATDVSGGGDFNNDLYNDFIVRDYNNVYLYFGGPLVDNVPDIIFSGLSGLEEWGNSIAFAGDLNNDGFDDLIIGDPGNESTKGQAFIYFGNDSLENTADLTLDNGEMPNLFGYSVTGIGDHNGDGFDDVIVGDIGSSYSGKALLFYGSENIDSEADLIIYGETYPQNSSNFSRAMAGAGDINNDGYADFILSDETHNNLGRVYLYLGGSEPDRNYDYIFDGLEKDSQFGWSLDGSSDINNDGISDVVIGSHSENYAIGKTYIYYGSESLDNEADIVYQGSQSNDFFAFSLSSGGDVNGDGKADVVIGAYKNDNNGATFLYFTGLVDDIKLQSEPYPKKFKLSQNYPNPFNPETVISYQLPVTGFVNLAVYNSLGQKITTLVDEQKQSGQYSARWDASNIASGVYFYRLTVSGEKGTFSYIKKCIFLK